MKIAVLLFGPAQDAAGGNGQVHVELPAGSTLRQLVDQLVKDFPGLRAGVDTFRFALNERIASPDDLITEGDEIAVIPPVSGGGHASRDDLIELCDAPLGASHVEAHLAGATNAGGLCLFEGRTRGEEHAEHGALVELAYEAYGSMALGQLRDLARRARERWPVEALAIAHRTGRVPIGEASVVIGVACAHRAEAFEACRWIIDTLKKEVAIWKKEQWQSGHATWVKSTPSS